LNDGWRRCTKFQSNEDWGGKFRVALLMLSTFGDSMYLLRRLLAILLLAFFGLPVVSPLFALSTDGAARLHACCRRDGKHHCNIGAEQGSEQLRGDEPRLLAPAESCPYNPAAAVAIHSNLLAVPTSDHVFALLASHPSGVVQTDSMRRISRDRSRQKRGPPTQI
jgi:hypothetical protein